MVDVQENGGEKSLDQICDLAVELSSKDLTFEEFREYHPMASELAIAVES